MVLFGCTDYPSVHQNEEVNIQAPGGSANVQWDSWSAFLAGNNFKGVYRPNTAPSSSDRDLFVSMGSNLVTEYIPYNVYYQVNYDTGTSGYWVDPAEITGMRCDGVVEYINEWYNFRIFGDDAHWDVTRSDYWIRDYHSGTMVTPSSQPTWMTRVTTMMWPQVYYQYGSTGTNVALIQSQLNYLGFWCGSADGIFGNNTKNAVINFQRSRGLSADGVVGFYTWNELFK